MASVAVDLSPVVTSLLEHPFDRPSLDRAYAAVGGHPQAYATALRCAAKKAPDSLAAAYWFAEAARIHEMMDDLGGAIALLWRAHECDRGNPAPRELLAATMVRLAMRAGLGFTFSAESRSTPAKAPPEAKFEPAAVDTGLRPSPFESGFRDTVPEIFGGDGEDAEDDAGDRHARLPSLRATLPSAILRPATLPKEAELAAGSAAAVALAEEDAELEELEEQDLRRRVEQLLPPPKDVSADSADHSSQHARPESSSQMRRVEREPERSVLPYVSTGSAAKPSRWPRSPGVIAECNDSSADSGVVQLSRSPSGEPLLRALHEPDPLPTEDEAPPSLRPPRPSGPPPAPSAKLSPSPSIIIADLATPEVAPSADHPQKAKDDTRAVPADPAAGEGGGSDDVYAGDDEAPPTLRPAGDRLVGGLFEALHGLHFIADVRHGASFVCRTLSDKMRAASTLVHLYDINSGHFLIVSAEGNRATALLDYATKEDDPLIALLMKGDDALLVQDAASDPRFARGRWALAEPKRSVLCAPVVSEGRPLGLIELADPDGGVFTEDDRNAVMYAASALSRFLDRRGLVLSDEPERSSPGPITE